MEPKKRKRGELSRQILASITPQEHARTFKQMAIAARIADALEAKGWSKSEFASRMNQLPSVVTRWLSGTQNFTIDTLSDIEEMLGVQLLVTDVTRPIAPTAGTPLLGEVVELQAGISEADFPAIEHSHKRIIEHHYVPVFYNAEPVIDACSSSGMSNSSASPGIQYKLIVNPSPSLN